jgi:hypothetical protein
MQCLGEKCARREGTLGYARNVFLHKQQVVWVTTVMVHL